MASGPLSLGGAGGCWPPVGAGAGSRGGRGSCSHVVAGLIRRAAFYSVPLPLAETIIASRLWVDAGGDVLDGAVTLAPVNPQDRLIVAENGSGMTLSGTAHHVPWGVQAPTALVFARDASGKGFLGRVLSAQLRPNRPRRNVAYEPRDEMHFDGVPVVCGRCSPSSGLPE